MGVNVDLTCYMLNKKKLKTNVESGGIRMNLRKVMAGTLAATMVVGSSMTVFSADGDSANSATGTGTSFNHVDKDVIDVTLPTQADVKDVFNYYVDPERVIQDAGSLADGTTTVTPNNDGVYFLIPAASDGGTASYDSSSKAVSFKGQNSVDVDVSVAATVTAGDPEKDITLVADEDALNAATTPALLMTLKVGNDSKAITKDGATAKATVAGAPDNFEVQGGNGDSNDEFKYVVKASPDESKWNTTTVQLSGKTNNKEIPAGSNAMTTPSIGLTWTIAKHVTYTDTTGHGHWSGSTLWLGKDANTGYSSDSIIVEVSDGGTTYTTLAPDKYSVNGDGWISTTWPNIVAGIGSEPTGAAFIRVTEGNTRYVFENE